MFAVRKEQLQILEQNIRTKKKERLAHHLSDAFAADFHNQTPAVHEGFTEMVVNEAESLGLESERDLLTYANIVMILGVTFTRDPLFEWTQCIREAYEESDRSLLLLELWEEVQIFADDLFGVKGEPYRTAIRKLGDDRSGIRSADPTESVLDQALDILGRCFPQKCGSHTRTEFGILLVYADTVLETLANESSHLRLANFLISVLLGAFWTTDPRYRELVNLIIDQSEPDTVMAACLDQIKQTFS